jgi:hypothetical protein
MKMPFRRSERLSQRLLHWLAKQAGIARLAIRQRTLRPHVLPHRNTHSLGRGLRRG